MHSSDLVPASSPKAAQIAQQFSLPLISALIADLRWPSSAAGCTAGKERVREGALVVLHQARFVVIINTAPSRPLTDFCLMKARLSLHAQIRGGPKQLNTTQKRPSFPGTTGRKEHVLPRFELWETACGSQ